MSHVEQGCAYVKQNICAKGTAAIAAGVSNWNADYWWMREQITDDKAAMIYK